jgi:hypothetical protein
MKTLTMIAVLAASFLTAGCGAFDKAKAYWGGGAVETCVDGVGYLQFTSGASVKYGRDGKVQVCE